jgi:hypothetical protein
LAKSRFLSIGGIILDKLTLKKPIMIDGAEVKEIKYDFDSLTTKDMAEAEKRMIVTTGQAPIGLEEANYTWHAYLFAAAAAKANPKADISDFLRIQGSDAFKARKLGRNFLLNAEDGDQENSEEQQ